MSVLTAKMLLPFREAHNTNVFVETGCQNGDGIAAAREAGFTTIYSCDVDAEAVQRCRERFKGLDVTIRRSTSTDFLRKFVPTLSGPTLFWLDAHFPAGYGNTDTDVQQIWPLQEELSIIRPYGDQHVVLADDMRVIRDPDNPTFIDIAGYTQDVRLKTIREGLPRHDVALRAYETGIMIWTPRSFA